MRIEGMKKEVKLCSVEHSISDAKRSACGDMLLRCVFYIIWYHVMMRGCFFKCWFQSERVCGHVFWVGRAKLISSINSCSLNWLLVVGWVTLVQTFTSIIMQIMSSVCLDVQETSSNGFGLSWQPCREIYSGSNLSVAYHIQSIYLFGWVMMLGSLLLFRADFICINTLTSSSLRRSRCLMSLLKHLGIWV